ncbi:hypothetical protein HY448_00375 [Candidatus Pacearchaeota archaeon]|nr:hypothetical protein [Candidatus Pacearchaeota archaeon]
MSVTSIEARLVKNLLKNVPEISVNEEKSRGKLGALIGKRIHALRLQEVIHVFYRGRSFIKIYPEQKYAEFFGEYKSQTDDLRLSPFFNYLKIHGYRTNQRD